MSLKWAQTLNGHLLCALIEQIKIGFHLSDLSQSRFRLKREKAFAKEIYLSKLQTYENDVNMMHMYFKIPYNRRNCF